VSVKSTESAGTAAQQLTEHELQARFADALKTFWHPVCTLAEVSKAAEERRPLALKLLREELAIALLADGTVVAMEDRCVHRSTRLSVGLIDGSTLRCAYHGWRYDSIGNVIDIPAMPEAMIPTRACVRSYSVCVAYDLVWVRLDDRMGTEIPGCSAWSSPKQRQPSMRVIAGAPYTWPVGAARRVENFVDLSHFAWVHDGSLGKRNEPVPPVPVVTRDGASLRFSYNSPDMTADDRALFGAQQYVMGMPLTVEITFHQRNGATRVLWMTASPISLEQSRCFWFVARTDALDEADSDHLAFQNQILAEDEPVVCNQNPPWLPLEPTAEMSVKTDRVSIEYRKFLRELTLAVDNPRSFTQLFRLNRIDAVA
jgi:phenylpropionate dioxygenase-like ring-hydroxylating dioxygenase large terminal subunit